MKKSNIVLRILGMLGVFLMVMILGPSISEMPLRLIFRDPSDAIAFLKEYLEFSGIWIVLLLYLFLRKSERPILGTLWTKQPGNTPVMFLIGLLGFGFGMNFLCAGCAMLHGDIYLAFAGMDPLLFAAFLVAVFIQSAAEELVCRVYLYQKLRQLFPAKAWIAIAGNALIFSALHLPNPGVTALALLNIALVGVLYSLIVYYTGSVWCAMAAHCGWNFTQNILLGLPNSGRVAVESVYKLDAASAANSLFYHTDFGVEGTVFACTLLALACVGVWLYAKKKGLQEHFIWENA